MIEMNIEEITPSKAAHYLKRNVDNYRRLSQSKVNLYAEEMKAGKWQNNGEGIMFGEDGRLKNGQHRLAAIMKAGVPVKMAVITGIPDSVTIYDVGSNRSSLQIAQASGCEGISRIEVSVGNAIVGRFSGATKGTLMDWLKAHKDELADAYKYCIASTGGRKASSRTAVVLAGYMMHRLGKISQYEIETFCRVMNSGNTVGADGYEPSPPLVARRMLEEQFSKANGRTMRDLTEVMVQAMTDFHEGKKRQNNYKISEPLKCLELMDEIRKQDKLK